ncbi:MAG: hypothetical protein HY540_03795 [Deltaproteobacteria bacterium]|nr:hypothetical protein [Deltaproteobacteria bacterium]
MTTIANPFFTHMPFTADVMRAASITAGIRAYAPPVDPTTVLPTASHYAAYLGARGSQFLTQLVPENRAPMPALLAFHQTFVGKYLPSSDHPLAEAAERLTAGKDTTPDTYVRKLADDLERTTAALLRQSPSEESIQDEDTAYTVARLSPPQFFTLEPQTRSERRVANAWSALSVSSAALVYALDLFPLPMKVSKLEEILSLMKKFEKGERVRSGEYDWLKNFVHPPLPQSPGYITSLRDIKRHPLRQYLDDHRSYEISCDQGIEALDQGKYDTAVTLLHETAGYTDGELREKARRGLAQAYFFRAETENDEGLMDKAIELADPRSTIFLAQSHDWLATHSAYDHIVLISARKAAELYAEIDQIDKAIDMLILAANKAEALEDLHQAERLAIANPTPSRGVKVTKAKGQLQMHLGRHNEAYLTFFTARNLVRSMETAPSPMPQIAPFETIAILQLMAEAAILANHFEAAEVALQEAVAIRSMINRRPTVSTEVLGIFTDRALEDLRSGHLHDALATLADRRSLIAAQAVEGPEEPS